MVGSLQWAADPARIALPLEAEPLAPSGRVPEIWLGHERSDSMSDAQERARHERLTVQTPGFAWGRIKSEFSGTRPYWKPYLSGESIRWETACNLLKIKW